MLKRLNIRIKGFAPLMMHNGQLANPMNSHAKAMKAITSKRKKTDDDMIELSRLEFMGGLYLDEKGQPCIPGDVIDGYFAKAAKTIRKGKQGMAGMSCDGNWPLIYKGPKTADKLWDDGGFTDVRGCRVNNSKVMRTRPIFANWELEFEITYDNELLDLGDIKSILAAGMSTSGLGDYTPKFGRFVVEKIEDLGPLVAAA